MRNRDISRALKLLSNLMELHGAGPEEIRPFASGSFQIDRLDVPVSDIPPEQLGGKAKIRKEAVQAVTELVTTGTIRQLEELIERTPPGILELFSLKGIGPKKIGILWKELGIESPGELYYACKENRLMKFKGFGAKTQEQLISAIEFRQQGAGKHLYAQIEDTADRLIGYLEEKYPDSKHSLTGEVLRKELIISRIEVLSTTPDPELSGFINPIGIPVKFFTAESGNFEEKLIATSCPEEYAEQALSTPNFNKTPPELRSWEPVKAVELFDKAGSGLVTTSDLKGILHAHSTYSDGMNTLEEMAVACQERGYEYFGICDHSKSAFYAGGLKPEAILKQHEEIDKLNQKLAPFKIFKGIESDILGDGSLDYPEEILQSFDFIVASVHSNLKMDQEKAMMRLIKAIENPYTTILGHMTGRLLLSRPGYPVDHKKIIDACAVNNVVIELNANPHRLDMDWEWVPYAMSKNVMISVNPDSHSIAEIDYVKYGIYSARKGGLVKNMTYNSLSLQEISKLFSEKSG